MRAIPICLIAAFMTAGGEAQSVASARRESALTLESSNPRLVEAFQWAKKQALAYVFDGDPVGPWYEASLPGREAFCMRDVSHQSMGAHALGLSRYTRNMLRRFAENISDSKDWCSYWEIDRYNRPAPVDYKSDAEFWYNLPANFDVLDCCYRMYQWTGDRRYLDDPVFLSFYDRTVNDFVQRWTLGRDEVMKRKRFINVRGKFDPAKNLQFFRGDPSYEENRNPFVLGVDLLAAEYAGFLAYSHIQQQRGLPEAAQTWLKKAQDIKNLVDQAWWDEAAHQFHSFLTEDYRLEGAGGSSLLYRDIAEDGPKARSALDNLLGSIRKDPSSSVEGQSHHAEILYRYGVSDVAYAQMIDLTREDRIRREYPEVAYSVVGAIVTGLMGVVVEPASPAQAALDGEYVDRIVRTLPALPPQTGWAELRNLPIRANRVSVRHENDQKTVLTNQEGPALIWQATFAGSFDTLLVDGKPARAHVEKGYLGRELSWVRTPVGSGDSVRIEVPPGRGPAPKSTVRQ